MTNERVSRIIAEATALGFSHSYSKRGHVRFAKPGCRLIFTSGTPSDRRAMHNAIAELRREARRCAITH